MYKNHLNLLNYVNNPSLKKYSKNMETYPTFTGPYYS